MTFTPQRLNRKTAANTVWQDGGYKLIETLVQV